MNREIRILLIDDHSLFRESLSRLLQAEPGFLVVGDYGSVKEALRAMEKNPVDLVLLDYDLGDEQAIPVIEGIEKRKFGGKILIVTAGMNYPAIVSLVDLGICGVFFKHSPPAQLIEVIRKVSAGEFWMDSKIVPYVLAHAANKFSGTPDSDELNSRERTVLRGVLEGLTNKEIGSRLAISESSVKAVLQRLFEKAGVRTRSQLVRVALEKHSHDWLAN